MATFSTVLFIFTLICCNSHRNNGSYPTLNTMFVSPLLLLMFCGYLFFFFPAHRTKQEPEETIWATHQVLLPGRGGKRPPLPPVSRWDGQRQWAMVGASRAPVIGEPSIKKTRVQHLRVVSRFQWLFTLFQLQLNWDCSQSYIAI